jgi:cytochrome c oxidase subunit II
VDLTSADLTLPTALVSTRHEYYRVYDVYVPIAVGVFALITVLVLFALLRYSRRPPSAAARWHEHNPLEGSYALLLACVVGFLLYLTFSAEHQTDTVANRERPALTIDVTGAKWEWTFYYRGYGITRRSGTVGRQMLVLPTDEAIRFNLTSLDVIHAFWVPELRYKHDLIPGSTQVATLTFTNAGRFPAACAEFCGLRHSDMVFTVDAVSASRFNAWAAAGGKGAAP